MNTRLFGAALATALLILPPALSAQHRHGSGGHARGQAPSSGGTHPRAERPRSEAGARPTVLVAPRVVQARPLFARPYYVFQSGIRAVPRLSRRLSSLLSLSERVPFSLSVLPLRRYALPHLSVWVATAKLSEREPGVWLTGSGSQCDHGGARGVGRRRELPDLARRSRRFRGWRLCGDGQRLLRLRSAAVAGTWPSSLRATSPGLSNNDV
jgi:hypothetical protein